MEKIVQTALIFLLLAAGTALPPAHAAEQTVIRRQAAEDYRNPETDLLFPARVESFEKVMVRINPDPQLGVSVSYEDEAGSLADVYIYRNEEPFDVHAGKAFRRVLDAPKTSSMIKTSESLGEPENAEGVFIARFRMTVEDESLISRLILFEKNGYYIKIRITNPETAEQEDATAHLFAQAILDQRHKTTSLTSGVEK